MDNELSGNLYLLDYKGNLDPSNLDVIRRHEAYGKAFRNFVLKVGKHSKIVALGRYRSRDCPHSENLEVLNTGSSSSTIIYLIKCYRILNKNRSQQMGLIAGDPWVSTIIALILRTALHKNVLLESQVHFDYSNYLKSQSLLKRKLLSCVTPLLLSRVNQIRVVDLNTLKLFESMFGNRFPIYFAPSILNLDSNFICPQRSEGEIVKLLWVGRIHAERNPIDFANLLNKLHECRYPFKARIVGSGPLEAELTSALLALKNAKIVEFVGEKFGAELFSEYCSADILVSCAAHESYGRTLREALFFGAKVLSRQTSGFNLLESEVENHLIRSFCVNENPKDLIEKIDWLRVQKVSAVTRQLLVENQQIILESLAMRWAYLLEPQLS